ncbi:wax ester/triacylglycerol synthase domain-containing protein [Microtetraspora glauca]|uniref:Wax ester/triacylglycerol synthase domain-containing protein n=1 Tax=Microtetraspora glauca TaxID=1996 RepID=A0ABV3GTV2_MICGL
MARQLSALDAQFLNFETTTNHTHIAGLAVLDPSTAPDGAITREAMIVLIRKRVHPAPPLRRRLVQVPFRLDHPYWGGPGDRLPVERTPPTVRLARVRTVLQPAPSPSSPGPSGPAAYRPGSDHRSRANHQPEHTPTRPARRRPPRVLIA